MLRTLGDQDVKCGLSGVQNRDRKFSYRSCSAGKHEPPAGCGEEEGTGGRKGHALNSGADWRGE